MMPEIEMDKEIKSEFSKETIQKRREYYGRSYVAFEIIKYARNREMAFLGAGYSRKDNIRYLNCGLLNIFWKNLGIRTNNEKEDEVADPFHFFDKNLNIYCSLAQIDWSKAPIKTFSYIGKQRREQQEEFKENLHEYLTDIEGAIDFDGDQDIENVNGKEIKKELEISPEQAIERARADCLKVVNLFNQFKIKWFCLFSGTRGLHLHFEVPMEISFDKKLDLINNIVHEIATTMDLKTIDRSKYNSRKVFKNPMSLVTKNNQTFVCLPLDDHQLKSFKISDMRVENVSRSVRLKDRGCLWRNSEISKEERIKYFKTFLNDMEIKI